MNRKSFSIFFVRDTFKVGHLMDECNVSQHPAAQASNNTEHLATRDAYRFRAAVSKLKGSSFVKHYELHDDKASVYYFGDYTSYRKFVPQTSLTKEDYLHYLGSEETVCQLLLDSTVYLLKELHFLNHITIEIPNHGKKYTVSVSRTELNEHLNCELSDMKDGHHHRYYLLCREYEVKNFAARFVKKKRIRRKQ
ncbi:hypothetical protein QUF79_21645 [Fictibacillus enclensis]|uniref:hypothetical protein n=1 Tax=Fictibacillus enclensis TaxID=1017270 RepID=UPI0025A1C967|nr:hypothetical protein [Fictibacillus enclensis]MDM5200627.1 hypothetical protein [Fictibacillus enclensis]